MRRPTEGRQGARLAPLRGPPSIGAQARGRDQDPDAKGLNDNGAGPKHSKGNSFEKADRRRGRPAWLRSPDDSPLRDANRDFMLGVLTARYAPHAIWTSWIQLVQRGKASQRSRSEKPGVPLGKIPSVAMRPPPWHAGSGYASGHASGRGSTQLYQSLSCTMWLVRCVRASPACLPAKPHPFHVHTELAGRWLSICRRPT